MTYRGEAHAFNVVEFVYEPLPRPSAVNFVHRVEWRRGTYICNGESREFDQFWIYNIGFSDFLGMNTEH